MKDCRIISINGHGSNGHLDFINKQKISQAEIRNALRGITGTLIDGIHFGACSIGTEKFADFILNGKDVKLRWLAGYAEKVDWIDLTVLDVLFFNELLRHYKGPGLTPINILKRVATQIADKASGLVRELGFGLYVRKKGPGAGVVNLLSSYQDEASEQLARLHELPHRRHLHRRARPPFGAGAEGGEDLRLRFADQSATSRSANAPDRQVPATRISGPPGSIADLRPDRPQGGGQRRSSSTSAITTPPIAGPSGGELRRTRPPGRLQSLRCVSVSSRSTRPGRAAFPLQAADLTRSTLPFERATSTATRCSPLACRRTGWATCGLPTRTAFSASPSHLPAEASEALLEYAGHRRSEARPQARPRPNAASRQPQAVPRHGRRGRTCAPRSTLPFEKWIVFLHPAQRGLVERDWTGPARVVGSAGTGKTVVALHRDLAVAWRATLNATRAAHDVLDAARRGAGGQAQAHDPPQRSRRVRAGDDRFLRHGRARSA